MWAKLLRDGREIRLTELHLLRTYVGVLEGPITAELNSSILSRVGPEARKMFDRDWPVVVIPPNLEDRPLPKLTCKAVFDSDAFTGSDWCGSSLIVVWFQNEPWPPEGHMFDTLDWENQAQEWDI